MAKPQYPEKPQNPPEQITIKTQDGEGKAWIFKPEGQNGAWPGVIFYTDAFGVRPGMFQMAAHVAKQGYTVLLPDLFYRFGAYGPYDPKELFKGDVRAVIGPMMASTDNLKVAQDAEAYLKTLSARADVKGERVGVVGFCMSGAMALTTAAYYPDRVAAAASFHGANLASDAPTSPHRLVAKIKGEVYVAGADGDHGYPPEMAQRLEQALTEGHVRHKCEIYKGKKHGWMKPDMPVFDAEGAERGWKELFALFTRNLK